MRILHVLHSSLPGMSGYSIRSDYIITCQQAMGNVCTVVTSAQHFDSISQSNSTPGILAEQINGCRYLRTPQQPTRMTGVREIGLMNALRGTIRNAIDDFSPDVIHAASPVLVGLPSLYEAKRQRIPLVYEVRDLWENTSIDRGKWSYNSLPYRGAKALESILFRRADAVVAISNSLKEEISPRIGKGISLSVVGNGVKTELFLPRPPCEAVLEKWQLQGKFVLGYIGAFQPYEGIEKLIEAMPIIAKSIPNIHLMITGGGNQMEKEIQALVRTKGLSRLITLTGRVPHSEVRDMYSVVDLMVYPRIRTRTTELTTPLKPLEAMSMKIPVLVSDTPAMLELISPGETGLAFKAGDSNALARACVKAVQNKESLDVIAMRARSYVEEYRHWPKIVASYSSIYEDAIQKNKK